MKNLLKNPKTSATGLAMMLGALIHLVSTIHSKTFTQDTLSLDLFGLLTGLGMLFAGDGATSAQSHAASTAAIENLKQTVATAVQTGDTTILTKPSVPTTPKP